MNRGLAAAAVLGLIMVLSAPPYGAAADRRGPAGASVLRGRALVQGNCGRCHATGRTGDSPNPAAPRLRTLHERYPIDDLAESMDEGLLNGHGFMPTFSFSNRQAGDIIAYLTSIQSRTPARHGR